MAHDAGTRELVELARAMRIVDTEAARAGLVETLRVPRAPTVVAFVNAHASNLAAHDMQLHDDLLRADVLLRDGTGAAILCRALGLDPGLNMNGTDLIPALIDAYAGRPVALLGTREPWLSAASERVRRTSPVPVVLDGFSETRTYEDALRRDPPDLIVLGMGMPKQERVAVQLACTLHHPCTIVCGGAIVDFLGGRVTRAPRWMQRIGFEWVWRLALEPRRLFGRYVVGNAVFLRRVAAVRRTVALR